MLKIFFDCFWLVMSLNNAVNLHKPTDSFQVFDGLNLVLIAFWMTFLIADVVDYAVKKGEG